MFNICVVFAGRAMVTVISKIFTRMSKTKTPSVQKKTTENERPSENMGFDGKTFRRFKKKKTITSLLDLYETTQKNTRTLNATVQLTPCNQKEMN